MLAPSPRGRRAFDVIRNILKLIMSAQASDGPCFEAFGKTSKDVEIVVLRRQIDCLGLNLTAKCNSAVSPWAVGGR
jgi:hypothetical protein